ncbi:MAG: sugar phosphate isomerase/epimerase [Opitutaceae bacterium]
MKKLPVALQLWSVRDEMRRDFASTVAAVGKIGYHGVELAGYGNLDVKGAKAALDAANLKVAGMHVGFPALRADLNIVINDALLLGSRHVTCPSWPAVQFLSAAACERIGEQLAEIGKTLRAVGLTFSFHNHAAELKVVEGRTVFDWMLGAAAPRDLKAEPDVYWLQIGGCPPVKFLRDHGARCPLVHLKDEKELGLGPVNFAEVFSVIDEVGAAEWLIVEQESYNHPPLESVRLCFEQLKSWGRV